MNFGLLLLPAVGGYWFVTHFNLTRFQAIRDSGYHILFRSVLVGIFWYVAAEIAIQLLDAYNPKITEFWDGRFSEPFTSPVVLSIALRRFLSLRAQLILFLDARCQESGQ